MTLDQADSFLTFQVILSILYIVTVMVVCLIIIFENRAPVKTLSWVLVVSLIPFIGILLYFFFGQNYRKRKIFSRKGNIDSEQIDNLASEQLVSLEHDLQGENSNLSRWSHLMTLILNNEKSILTADNEVSLLKNAEETYSSMLNELSNAKHHIHLEVYRFEIDDTGNRFREILKQKASEGVKIRVIFDDVGSWSFKKRYVDEMRRAGVQIFPFFPVRFPQLASKLNYRNHRKILVIDGRKGFIGGMNIADKYVHGVKKLGKWRDTHLMIEGEAVEGMNRIFLTDWYFLSGEFLMHEQEYFPAAEKKGKSLIQFTSSGPDSDWANIMQVYFSVISSAEHKIYICSPYFSPNESILTALKTAALAGKDVRIILPERSDSAIAHWNNRSYLTELLHAGVRVFLYNSGFNHSKYIVVDNTISSVGSVNVDMRSFDMNFEVTAIIYDKDFAGKLEELFFTDLDESIEVDAESWAQRPRREKYKESLARIFGLLY